MLAEKVLCMWIAVTLMSYQSQGLNISCPRGTFGHSCTYACNCGTSCNSTTGVCSGGCDVGWREGHGTLCQKRNIAYRKTVSGSGVEMPEWTAGKAVDGNRDQDVSHNSCYHSRDYPTFWWVDLAAEYRIHSVRIYNRAGYPGRLANCSISVGPRSDADTVCYTFPSHPPKISDVMDLTCDGTGRFFIIRNPGRAPGQHDTLNICEVEIYVCSNGTFGPNCSEFCHCLNSTCDHVTGACPGGCRSGWEGDNCSTQCSGGTFGPNCSEFCHCLNSTCDHVTGACPGGCRSGWKGDNCSTQCSGGTFGPNCSEFCHCLNSTCDHVTGTCPGGCRPGWEGDNCSTRCSVGSYGIDCQKSCSNRKCNGDRSSCDHRSGSCDTGCRAGWRQSDCTQECDSLHYGTNCSRACADRRCALNTSWCDHVTGICDTGVCQAGWKGIACTEAAPSKTTGTVVIVSCSVGVLVLLLVAVGVVVWRTKRRTVQNHRDDVNLHEVPAEDLSPESAEEPTRSTYASLGDRSEADNRQYEALRVTGSDMYINC